MPDLYDDMSFPELVSEADQRGIDRSRFERRDDYLIALRRDDRDRSEDHGEVEP